ncbi:MAG: hypothetical protein REI78_15510 [Pedobacter sp.]|nr:hypothetical protein [Pedobacter sp.]MDQ8054438.1 hypothetical protein [Pedobacter sp.]
MENTEILKLWKQYDEKLEKNLSLNQRIISELQQQKAKKALTPVKRIKWGAVLIGIIYIGFLGWGLYHLWPSQQVFLLGSITGHLLFCIAAIILYLRQLIVIHEIDVSENIIHIQQRLALLQTSTVKVVALCLLQLPLFSTFNITLSLINDRPFHFWLIQMPIVALFTVMGLWLYINVHPRNADKRWFRILFCGSEWSSILRAGKLLKEIDELVH